MNHLGIIKKRKKVKKEKSEKRKKKKRKIILPKPIGHPILLDVLNSLIYVPLKKSCPFTKLWKGHIKFKKSWLHIKF